MSNWKVSKQEIELFSHPEADTLQLAKIGTYQVVIKKDQYKTGDIVIFAPEKSMLTGAIEEGFKPYLVGPNKNRVKAIRLRGEVSSGIIIPPSLIENIDLSTYSIGEDISEILGITKYEPPIPVHLQGDLKPITAELYGRHDCEQIGVYINELIAGERIIASEKIHGSMCTAYRSVSETFVTSKGYLKNEQSLVESESNAYWRAIRNTKIFEKIEASFPIEDTIQVFGELIPCQGKGFNYGVSSDLVVKIFDIRKNGISIPYDVVPDIFKEHWVPIIYDGPFIDIKHLKELCKGNEMVSGKSLHIREGIVVSPYIDRISKDGTKLRLKVINPSYKETGEEIN
jgi:RNA ligase (TIGR02306 family)